MSTENTTSKESQKQQREELEAFEKLRQEFKRLLADTREKVSPDVLRQTLDKAVEEVKALGGHTAENIAKAAEAVKKDVAHAAEQMGPKWESFSEKSADVFEVWRDRGEVFMAHAASAVGGWLRQIGRKLEHKTYHTGDMTYGGTFKCTNCGEHLQLNRPGHVPPCPNCFKTEFQRI